MIDPAGIRELKAELELLHPDKIRSLCLQLARYKKENKEYLSYLLFMSDDHHQYAQDIKVAMDDSFKGLNTSTGYLSAKGLRKILKTTNKFIKFSADKQVEAEVLSHFCLNMLQSGVRIHSSTVLSNMYEKLLERIVKAANTLHEEQAEDIHRSLQKLRL